MNYIIFGVLLGASLAMWGIIGIMERMEENEIAYLQKLIDRFNEQQIERAYREHMIDF